MSVRIISSIILVPFLILVAYGNLPLKIGVIAIALMGLQEFYNAFSKKNLSVHMVGYIFSVIYVVMIEDIMDYFNLFVAFYLVFLLFALVFFHKRVSVKDILITFFGFFYVTFLISHIYLIRSFAYGKYLVWLCFICAWGCDTGAYFTGYFFGKHKLIPDLSPKKTVEGAIGGVIVSVVLSFIFAVVIEKIFILDEVNTILICTLTGAIGSVFAQFGDLFASAVKRYNDIKDFSDLIPGHGGILDRFDSILTTAPVLYILMVFLINI